MAGQIFALMRVELDSITVNLQRTVAKTMGRRVPTQQMQTLRNKLSTSLGSDEVPRDLLVANDGDSTRVSTMRLKDA